MANPPNSVGNHLINATSTTTDFKSHQDISSHVDHENQTWVQCESPGCLKWRLLPRVDNGGVRLSTEQAWFCSMNPDPAYSSCTVPQQHIPTASLLKKHGLNFIFSQLPVGSLVSAKMKGWPWWPAILSPDPGTGMHLILDDDGCVSSYHVEFLGKPHSRCWAKAQCVGSYRPIAAKQLRALKGTDRKSWDFAVQEAHQTTNMSCEERLLFCHFQPNELLTEAQKLMWDIEDLMKQFNSGGRSSRRPYAKDKRSRLCQGRIEEDGDVLVIEGFRFESAACREELRSPGSQPGPSSVPCD